MRCDWLIFELALNFIKHGVIIFYYGAKGIISGWTLYKQRYCWLDREFMEFWQISAWMICKKNVAEISLYLVFLGRIFRAMLKLISNSILKTITVKNGPQLLFYGHSGRFSESSERCMINFWAWSFFFLLFFHNVPHSWQTSKALGSFGRTRKH